MTQFGHLLRHWRATRRMSQMDLALEANISARHVSFLETGRSAPSRMMVQHMSDILAIPRGERNAILEAAGFLSLYRRLPIEDAQLARVRAAMTRIITHHRPYPALIKDRHWRLVELNPAAEILFGMAGLKVGDCLLEAIATPGAGAALIENWGEVGYHTLQRLRGESRAEGGIPELDAAIEALSRDPDVMTFQPTAPLPPIVSTVFRAGDLRLPLFSTFAHLGGAEELSLNELVIELMFPADADAEAQLLAMQGSGSAL